MAVAWPNVKNRLVTWLPTLPGMEGAVVYDGPVPDGDDPAAGVTVGWQPSTDDESAGSFAQDVGPDGFLASEIGSVLMEFAVVTGDSVVPSAFALVDALQSAIQRDQTLGGLLVVGSTVTVAVDVVNAQNTRGAAQRLLASVNYTTNVF